MASLNSIINLTITRDSVGVKRKGFGVPLVLSPNAAYPERIRFYEDIAGVEVDFATTTPEYKMATRLFSQKNLPEKIAIGRTANKPTQKYTVTPAVVANSTAYKLYINGTSYTFTSDANATDTEIVDGLAALINAGSGDTLTATTPGAPGTETLVLTANAPGDWNAVEVDNPAFLGIVQDHADPGLAADLAAIALENSDWYFILYPYNSKAAAVVIGTYAETNKKVFLAQSSDSNNATLAIGADTNVSLMGTLKTGAFGRTAVIYHPDPEAFADAAWVGAVAPLTPGSETWIYKTLVGVDAVNLTATHTTNIEAKFGNYYQEISGVNSTIPGSVSSGEWIDVVRGLDWLDARIKESVFGRLAAADKIPYTDKGIAVVQSEIMGVLREGVANGLLSDDPAPATTVPKASAASAADKQARRLRDVKFTGTLAGAIHGVDVNGVVSV